MKILLMILQEYLRYYLKKNVFTDKKSHLLVA